MAATPTPRPTPAEAGAVDPVLAALLRQPPPAFPVAIAYSGGADSSALLLAAAQAWPGQVRALHVHHGLQPAADGFERHCVSICAGLRVPLQVARVDARHASGESPEDAARKARYAALAAAARKQGAACVLLAQHADDQAETLLLALSRGAGLPGLAAMAPAFERHGMLFQRPLLAIAGPVLRARLARSGAAFVEDPSNADTQLTRNRIRHLLMPALEAVFPQFRETFARSARHAARAQELLAALAADDLAGMGGAPVIARLQALPRERQGNLLRHWLRTVHGAAASSAQLQELLDQVADCTTRGHDLRLKVGKGSVLRQDERLGFAPADRPPPGAVAPVI